MPDAPSSSLPPPPTALPLAIGPGPMTTLW